MNLHRLSLKSKLSARCYSIASGLLAIFLVIALAIFCAIAKGQPLKEPNDTSMDRIDPCLGLHWHVVVNQENHSGPDRIILTDTADAQEKKIARHAAAKNILKAVAISPQIIIHVGDQIIVDQESELLHARLPAMALESGPLGARLRARLSAGKNSQMSVNGPVISVLATGLKQAKWLPMEWSSR
ncbi:hypothetical protein [Acidicapsa ligni]|uniref:hypothetical protein n=1 Tax=Acidicapsa ligni TaxID=542300 RepID=UPI0021E09B53|nr:hypothetical protein [Acidicapsa ligni]